MKMFKLLYGKNYQKLRSDNELGKQYVINTFDGKKKKHDIVL